MKQRGTLHLRRDATKSAKVVTQFWTKFNNDWSWPNSAGLAYSLILSMFPLVLVVFALLGLFVRNLDLVAYNNLVTQITTFFPAVTSSQNIIQLALKQLTRQSGVLGLVAVVLAIFNGSRLFLLVEGALDIIYHVPPRGIVKQNIMAVSMVLLFVILFPLMVIASSLPALAVSFLQKTPLAYIPGSGIFFGLSGVFGSLIAGYILFQVIYIVVPNQKVSIRNSWLGAVVAALLLELYLVLFPLYVSYFLGSFAGALGLLILLIFFYYFALILFLGAEVNAFFAEGVRETPYDLVTMVHIVTSHLPTSEEAMQKQAASGYKDEVPKEIHSKPTQDYQEELHDHHELHNDAQ